MKTDMTKWAFRNRNLIYFLIAVLVVGGVLSAWQMSKLEDPEVKVKLAIVVTTYPGASAASTSGAFSDRWCCAYCPFLPSEIRERENNNRD